MSQREIESGPESEGLVDESADELRSRLMGAAQAVCDEVLLPNATRADLASTPLPENYRALGRSGLLGLAVPLHYGGFDAPGSLQRDISELLASCCGVTHFVQAQHHGPCRMIYSSRNETLRRILLNDLATGRRMCGISFAHLRRPGPPVLCAEEADGGYRLFGSAPWVTGWGLMDQFVFGASLDDRRIVYLWAPVDRDAYPELFSREPEDGSWGEMIASPPMALCAMNGSGTVELTLNGFFVPEDHRLGESDRDVLARNDRANVLGATAMPLGCALGAIRLLRQLAERRRIPEAALAADRLEHELNETRAKVLAGIADPDDPELYSEALKLRAGSLELAMRAAQTAVAASSGSANLLTNPAGRLIREALFYTVQAQTRDVMNASFQQFTR